MTDTQTIAGGRTTPAQALVTADQETILGDGTPENPLRLAGAGGSTGFEADFTPELPFTPTLGIPVVVNPNESTKPANANTDVFAVGLVTAIDDGGIIPVVTVRTAGSVTLTTAEWDDVTGGSGGLTGGALYFLDDVDNGGLIQVAPSDSGTFICQVGIALNPTTMLLTTPVVPIENP